MLGLFYHISDLSRSNRNYLVVVDDTGVYINQPNSPSIFSGKNVSVEWVANDGTIVVVEGKWRYLCIRTRSLNSSEGSFN